MATTTTLEPVIETLARQEDGESLFEIIDGQRVELPPMSAYAGRVASRLLSRINEFASPRGLGEAVMEVLFHLPLPVDRNRRPDVAFVSEKRWPKGKRLSYDGNAWDVVPNLGVEVISPNDLVDELMEKIEEYFQAGMEQVWVIYPRWGIIHVFDSSSTSRLLHRDETLEGGDILPGFRLTVATLFPDEPETPGNAN